MLNACQVSAPLLQVRLCYCFCPSLSLLPSSLSRCHKDDIETLFYLLKVFMFRHVTSFPFLKSYLENDVAKQYSIEQKRSVFFKFVEIFSQNEYSQELKAKVSYFITIILLFFHSLSLSLSSKVLQYILIPVFTVSFEEGERDEVSLSINVHTCTLLNVFSPPLSLVVRRSA